jgi:hypothetical protein
LLLEREAAAFLHLGRSLLAFFRHQLRAVHRFVGQLFAAFAQLDPALSNLFARFLAGLGRHQQGDCRADDPAQQEPRQEINST